LFFEKCDSSFGKKSYDLTREPENSYFFLQIKNRIFVVVMKTYNSFRNLAYLWR